MVTFKYVTKTIAMRRVEGDIHAQAGLRRSRQRNACQHLLFRGLENAFYDPETPLNISDLARFFVGGLIEHASAITAIANP